MNTVVYEMHHLHCSVCSNCLGGSAALRLHVNLTSQCVDKMIFISDVFYTVALCAMASYFCIIDEAAGYMHFNLLVNVVIIQFADSGFCKCEVIYAILCSFCCSRQFHSDNTALVSVVMQCLHDLVNI